MRVQRVLFNDTFYDSGIVKYAEGKHYPKTAQTESLVLAGHAKYLDVDMPKEDAVREQNAADKDLAIERKRTIKAEEDEARGGDAMPGYIAGKKVEGDAA
jgi:hypothetical protein